MSTMTITPQVSYRPQSAARKSSMRLTRRGRLVVFAFGVLVAFALGVWFAAGSVATQEAGVEQVEVVTVAPGETLWDIAADAVAVTGEGDVAGMVARIEQMNDLESSMLFAGQELRVPTE
ncbi:LysM peptidoglycan-binding domain-containing protein [Nocardioides stalactiti]|uniref:LysM peptidoglycan-binding domain-containing protein n=1 Tax=Nocardioides stalactiti TaxID=2755356 RepID=UPI001600AA9F|nr:LysM peptidoglycan-binding domain-containing protein [Nocardioides stalactiti]